MSQKVVELLINQLDFFKILFGGKLLIGNDEFVPFGPSPILLTGFIAGLLALALVVVIFICYRNKLLEKTGITVLSLFTIALFVTGGVLFCFKDVAAMQQQRTVVTALLEGSKGSEELLAKLLNNRLIDLGVTPIIFAVTQFIGAGALTAGLIVENVRKY